MAITRAVCLIPAALLCLLVTDTCAQTAAKPSGPAPAAKTEPLRQLHLTSEPWTGDFDKMLERRVHPRPTCPTAASLYFVDRGRERGIAAELIRDFERYLNKKYARAARQASADGLHRHGHARQAAHRPAQGLADVAVGNLTVTPERLKVVDFVAPDEKLVNVEILVTGPASPAIASLEELSGEDRARATRPRSYYASLVGPERALQEGGQGSGQARPRSPTRSRTRTCWR